MPRFSLTQCNQGSGSTVTLLGVSCTGCTFESYKRRYLEECEGLRWEGGQHDSPINKGCDRKDGREPESSVDI